MEVPPSVPPVDDDTQRQFFEDRPLTLKFESDDRLTTLSFVRRDAFDAVMSTMNTLVEDLRVMMPGNDLPPASSDALREVMRYVEALSREDINGAG